MRLIGLTGRSGSGKSTVAKCAFECGCLVLDCDRLYSEMTSKRSDCLLAIAQAFGDDVIRDNALDRAVLRNIVYHDPEALQHLNRITSEYMSIEIFKRLSNETASVAILDAPTLFECGIDLFCDGVIGVIASDNLCVRRIIERDRISESDAILRLRQQHPNSFFIENCDYILYNEGNITTLESDSKALLSDLMEENA